MEITEDIEKSNDRKKVICLWRFWVYYLVL